MAAPTPSVRRSGRTPMWAKLCSFVISANLAGFLIADWVARWVRAVPETATQESGLLFAYYGAMLLIGIIDALLIDEIAFRGAFRRTTLGGYGARNAARGTADVEDMALASKPSGMTFPVLVLLCGGVTYFLFNAVNHDFDRDYRRIGRDLGILAHGDEPERIEALRRVAILRGEYLPRVIHALTNALAEGGEPARWAAWGMGKLADQPRTRPLIPPLVEATRSSDPGLRKEALFALGRLQHRASGPAIADEVRRQHEAGEVDPRMLYALGAVQVLSSREILETLLYQAKPSIQGLAAWALAQHRDQVGGDALVDVLEARLPSANLPLRCDIVHALGILAAERSNRVLMQLYDTSTPEERATQCESRRLSLRPDGGPQDWVDLFMPADAFGMRIIATMAQMRATSPEIRQEVEPWLERLIADPTTAAAPQTAAGTLLEGIRTQRDDTGLPSVEEALGLDRSGRRN